MDHVAAAAGVSRATVSRVINNAASVAPEIRAAVQRAIASTGYVPNVAARSLVTRRSGSVALVISEPDRPDDHSFLNRIFTDPYFGRVTAGATGALRPHGVHLVVVPTDATDHHQVVRYLRQGHVDGVLLISSNEHDPLPAQVHALGIPAVLASRPPGPLPVSYVDVDQRAGARLAAEHLIGRGCRRLATISGPLDIPAGSERLAGFRSAASPASSSAVPSDASSATSPAARSPAASSSGSPLSGSPLSGSSLSARPEDVPAVIGDFTRAGGEAAAHALLDADPSIDGLFVASDLMAAGALRAVQDRGRRVPDDVAVVGFDDSSAALECRPLLTTVRQPVEEMAAEMAALLLAHIADPGRSPRSVIFQPALVVRDSA